MFKPCKVCDDLHSQFSFLEDVCDRCASYDWGHWRIEYLNRAGFLLGAIAAIIWSMGLELSGSFGVTLFLMSVIAFFGGIVGDAVTQSIIDIVFNGLLLKWQPSDHPIERRREAEKYYYISLLAAFQGKNQFAIRMLQQAKRHGWDQWELLMANPAFGCFSRLSRVQSIVT